MTELKLNVADAVTNAAFKPHLCGGIFPEGVRGKYISYSENDRLVPPEDGALLLITDSIELLKCAAENKNDRFHIIYIGKYREIEEVYGSIDELWYPEEPQELLEDRLKKFIIKLRDEFDLWFYKNALISTINTVPDMLWFKRIDGIHMLVNDAFTEIVHKPKSDIHGKDHFYIWDAPRPDKDAEGDFACAESEEIAISTGETYIGDETVKTKEGMKQFITYKTPVYDKFGGVFGTVGVGHDVTNFSNLGIELSILMENMPSPMTIFTPDWKVVRMNTHFREIVSAHRIENFDYKNWKATVPVPIGELSEDKKHYSISREYQLKVNGKKCYFMITELEIHDFFDNVSGYFCIMQDITYQRAYEQSILKAANTDMLTGMYNRRYFYNFLTQNTGKPFKLLYLDLDRFKLINDSYGHATGDEVLIKTAELIKKYFPDTLNARLGGDEFVVLDEKNGKEETEKRCLELETAVRDAFTVYGKNTAISIGVTETDGSTDDIDRLIRESDERMYEIKKSHHDG